MATKTQCNKCGKEWDSAPPGYIHKCQCGAIMSPKYNPELAKVNSLKEFTNDAEERIAVGAIKYDGGKAPVFRGCLDYFPRALEAVSEISAFGASKYAWKGWEGVADGFNRYSDAMVRHVTYQAKGEILDPDSGLLHAAHCAWNALARLEIMLKEKENA